MPLSKSVSNRALIINALAGAGAPDPIACCADTAVMADALYNPDGTPARIDVGASGTAMRFLTSYYAALPGCDTVIDGCERMRRRPIGPLVDALRSLGASVEYTGEEGFPPLHIRGTRLSGGDVEINAEISSQFISALLLVAPMASGDVTVRLEGEPVSAGYVAMTLAMMKRQGIDAEASAAEITVHPGKYTPIKSVDEGDWSAASYWYEIAALSAGWIELTGLLPDSIQGDRRVADIYDALCVGTEWEDGVAALNPSPDQAPRLNIDLTDNPDLAPALAVTCCMLSIPFRFTGLQTLRIKECDRLEALRTELLKISFVVEHDANGTLVWEGMRGPVLAIPSIDTRNDHRLAMAFAPVSVFCPGIEIRQAEAVEKSYPEFWNDMRRAGFTVVPSDEVPEHLRRAIEGE